VSAFSFRRCEMNIGIVGARKYKDKQSVIDLVNSLPADSRIVTSTCKGPCVWAKEAVEVRGMRLRLFAPDLKNIRGGKFEVAKRYYERNKQMILACDYLHAFVSEDGYVGGIRFEIQYALKLEIPVEVHFEDGKTERFPKYPFPFIDEKSKFMLSWQDFFCKTDLNLGEIL
jgi:hypothetical protein